MKMRLFGLLAAVVLLGAGCSLTTSPGDEGRDCASVPQVFFMNKLAFSEAELTSIRENVTGPLIAYYESGEVGKVVSIMVTRTETGINVEAIIDQSASDEPIYHGFIHPRNALGLYPRWIPEEVPPGYSG